MAHEQRLADACTSKSDIKTLINKTSLCNLVKVFQVEGDLVLLLMIVVESFVGICKVIVTNVIVKRDC